MLGGGGGEGGGEGQNCRLEGPVRGLGGHVLPSLYVKRALN